jgi:2-polyprenyl-3-methyl-5-hydroxy-6-metoxy-1,4-benzoquinol methylase
MRIDNSQRWNNSMKNSKKPDIERLGTRAFTISAVEHLHRYALAADICHGKDVLDIASGEGYGSNLLAKKSTRVTGVDISNEVIEHARTKYVRPNLAYVQGAVDAIPMDSSSVDVVVSFETLEHHDKHEEMLSEIKRVLRPSGVLVISTPDRLFYSDIPHYMNEFHVKELYLDEFKNLIQRFFRRQRLLFQGLAYGTLITPDGDWGRLSYYRGDFETCEPVRCLTRNEYNIAIASDDNLPEACVSFFDGMRALQDYKQQMEREEERIPHLERRLRSQEQVIRELRNSMSYRFGRSATWPFRKLFNSGPG